MKFLSKVFNEETLKQLKEKLGDLYEQVEEATSDFEVDLSEQKFIPYNRFKEVNEQAKDFKSQIDEREKQLKSLAEQNKGNEELQKRISELQAENDKAKNEYEHKIKARELDYTIETLAMKNKVRNAKAFRALLDLESIGDDFSKLDDQVKAIKESDSYLFEIEEEQPPKRKVGLTPNQRHGDDDEFADFRKLR